MSVVTDERVNRYKIRVQMVGDRSMLPADLLEAITSCRETAKELHPVSASISRFRAWAGTKLCSPPGNP